MSSETRFVVEKGNRSDVDELAELYDALNDHFASRINYPGWIKGIYPIRDTAEKAIAEGSLFVCREGGDLAGSVVLNHVPEAAYAKTVWPTRAEYDEIVVVRTLAVHPRCFKKGVALRLLKFAENYAVGHEQKAIRLDVFTGNTPAIALYEKFGFRYVDTVDLELGIPELQYFRLYELPCRNDALPMRVAATPTSGDIIFNGLDNIEKSL